MNFLKKIGAQGLTATVFMLSPILAWAQTTTTSATAFTIQNPLKVNSVGDFIQTGVTIFTYLVILFAVLAFVWVGFQYILARGKPDRMKELSSWLLAIVIGVAIVIGARLLIQLVINTLSASGVVSSGVIQSATNALQKQ